MQYASCMTGELLMAQVYVALIAFFNYYYTFLQLEPKDLADSLKRQARDELHLRLP